MPKTDKAPKPKTTKARLSLLHTISASVLCYTARKLTNRQLAELLRAIPPTAPGAAVFTAKVMGTALRTGEVTIPDSTDIPAKLRKANLARIQKIKDPKVRAEFLAGKGTPNVVKPAKSPAKPAS
jgi:hypothetical protein